ncbi:hypothetical protein CEXT_690301 [Caerostris extrusa]|uniref:Uncharacterized protein n=1 Tax=Caerostris extrusa TaxID=172846 RepID=A0AAV4W5D8_CAEEX|nr:hypothetical protein CEXT_690301 [Caerostris extrusa]
MFWPRWATQIILMLTMIIGFYTTSFQAVAVHDAAKRVKNFEGVRRGLKIRIFRSRNQVSVADDGGGVSVEVVVTGWGMFFLKRSFCRRLQVECLLMQYFCLRRGTKLPTNKIKIKPDF